MANLADLASSAAIKQLYLGHSGTGKTGSLASLAVAGYKLHIIDFDNGWKILANALRDKGFADRMSNIEVETFTDKYKTSGANPIPVAAQAWSAALRKLTSWTDQYQSLDDIIVIDSLNLGTRAAFNYILQLAGRLLPRVVKQKGGGEQIMRAEQSDWGAAQDLITNFLLLLYSDQVKSHVIVTSHIQYLGDPSKQPEGEDSDDDIIKLGFPMTAVGKNYSITIPKYFNSTIMAREVFRTPSHSTREISTKSVDYVSLKSEAFAVKPSYPLARGMADYFAAVRGVKYDPKIEADLQKLL